MSSSTRTTLYLKVSWLELQKAFPIEVSSVSAAVASPKRFLEDRETAELRDDLALAKEEGTVSKEVIGVLRKQLEAMEKEKQTM